MESIETRDVKTLRIYYLIITFEKKTSYFWFSKVKDAFSIICDLKIFYDLLQDNKNLLIIVFSMTP